MLLLTLAGFLVFNSLTALSANYALTLLARLLAGYARRMVPVRQQGRAMAVAMVGTPIALSLGVPLGTWLGGAIGWRSAFAIMSALSLVLIAWVPDYPGQAGHQRMPLRKVFVMPGVRRVLGVVVAWMLAHNLLYTYVAPFAALAGQARHVDLVLLVFGLAALAGIAVTSRLVDRHLRAAVLASLAGFALLFAGFAALPAVLYGGAAAWRLSFGGAATLLQTALADNAGDGTDVALSMNVVAWNGAIAGGGLLGGVLLDAWGAASFAPALVLLLAIGLVTAWSGSAHGFRPGPRHTEGG